MNELIIVLIDIQDQIKSAMDETKDYRSIIIGHTEETGSQAGGLVSEEILHATNTGNSGKFSYDLYTKYFFVNYFSVFILFSNFLLLLLVQRVSIRREVIAPEKVAQM